MTWLRTILVHNLAHLVEHHHAGKRDARRQQSLEDELGRSSAVLHRVLAAPITSPSTAAARREDAVRLADAVARLPDDQREVFILHHLEHRSFEFISSQMGRSPGAARMLLSRALLRLSQLLKETP